MPEHVGKKRRKEVREAVNMRNRMRKDIIVIAILAVVGIVLTTGLSIAAFTMFYATNPTAAQVAPLAVMVVLVMYMGNRAFKWASLREQYRYHCKKYNITKEDMRALVDGDM